MSKRTPPTHPQARRQVVALGERLRAARLRRKMTQPMLAERVGVSVPTIGKLESGDPTTSLATMLRVLTTLGLGDDIDMLAAQDSLGRSLQDNALKRPMPSSSRTASSRRSGIARGGLSVEKPTHEIWATNTHVRRKYTLA